MSRRTGTLRAALAAAVLAWTALAAHGAPGDLYASINGGPGNGAGSVYAYTPDGTQDTFASALNRPRGLAFDGAGNLFVATTLCDVATCRPTILKVAPGSAPEVFAVIPGSVFAQGLAIDGSGHLFVVVVATNPGTLPFVAIHRFDPEGTRKLFAMLPGHPGQGFGLAFDSGGDLYVASTLDASIYRFAPDGRRSVFVGPEAFSEFGTGPIGLAFDHAGNLFVSTEVYPYSDDRILKFTPDGVMSTFAAGLRNPRALAFDSAGNLFVGETAFFGTGSILKFAPDGTSTVFASGIGTAGFGGPIYFAMQP